MKRSKFLGMTASAAAMALLDAHGLLAPTSCLPSKKTTDEIILIRELPENKINAALEWQRRKTPIVFPRLQS